MAAVRFHATVRRVGGEPTDSDPGSWITDLRIPRTAAHENKGRAEEQILDSLSRRFGGEFEIVSVRTSFLGGRR